MKLRIAFLLTVLALPVFAGILIPTESVTLNRRDKSALTRIACNHAFTGGDVIEADRILESNQIHVRLTCSPHDSFEGLPVVKVANCDNMSGFWACSSISSALAVSLSGGVATLAYPSGINPGVALEIANYATTVRSFSGRDVAAYFHGRCRIYDGKSVPFEGALNFEIGCDGWHASITKDCWDDKCRLFFTSFNDVIF